MPSLIENKPRWLANSRRLVKRTPKANKLSWISPGRREPVPQATQENVQAGLPLSSPSLESTQSVAAKDSPGPDKTKNSNAVKETVAPKVLKPAEQMPAERTRAEEVVPKEEVESVDETYAFPSTITGGNGTRHEILALYNTSSIDNYVSASFLQVLGLSKSPSETKVPIIWSSVLLGRHNIRSCFKVVAGMKFSVVFGSSSDLDSRSLRRKENLPAGAGIANTENLSGISFREGIEKHLLSRVELSEDIPAGISLAHVEARMQPTPGHQVFEMPILSEESELILQKLLDNNGLEDQNTSQQSFQQELDDFQKDSQSMEPNLAKSYVASHSSFGVISRTGTSSSVVSSVSSNTIQSSEAPFHPLSSMDVVINNGTDELGRSSSLVGIGDRFIHPAGHCQDKDDNIPPEPPSPPRRDIRNRTVRHSPRNTKRSQTT